MGWESDFDLGIAFGIGGKSFSLLEGLGAEALGWESDFGFGSLRLESGESLLVFWWDLGLRLWGGTYL